MRLIDIRWILHVLKVDSCKLIGKSSLQREIERDMRPTEYKLTE